MVDISAVLEAVAWCAWVARVLILAGVVVAAVWHWAIFCYDGQTPPLPHMCPCFGSWKSLDERWGNFMFSFDRFADMFGLVSLSALIASIGELLGWFSGRARLRLPFDDLFYETCFANYRRCGCARGEADLVAAADATEDPPAVRGMCPTLVALLPQRFVRREAMDAARW